MTINYKKKGFKNASFCARKLSTKLSHYFIRTLRMLLLLNNLLFVLENQVQNYLIILYVPLNILAKYLKNYLFLI